MMEDFPLHMDDWEILTHFLPDGWQEQAKKLGAMTRCRKFNSPEVLLRTLLIHLAEGISLKETVARAKMSDVLDVTNVALHKRLKTSSKWLRWMAEGVMLKWFSTKPVRVFGEQHRIRLIDGSVVKEPGPTGSLWRLHYSIQFPSLLCDEVLITSQRTGETFRRFAIRPNDLLIADRGFANRPGIGYVVKQKANVIVRCNLNLPVVDKEGKPFDLLKHLQDLPDGKVGDWRILTADAKHSVAGRICAIRKSKTAQEVSIKKLLRRNNKQGKKVKPETLEAARYIFVFTTLDPHIDASRILELYRGRWQVELAFKRLKSIIGVGHLRKTDPDAAKAWLHGKMLTAFLVESMIYAAERFFPWGFPLDGTCSALPVEGNIFHAPFGETGH